MLTKPNYLSNFSRSIKRINRARVLAERLFFLADFPVIERGKRPLGKGVARPVTAIVTPRLIQTTRYECTMTNIIVGSIVNSGIERS